MHIPNPLEILGPLPIGDPDAMRALATRLRAAARKVDALGTGVVERAQTTTFEGPAGKRFKASVKSIRSRTRREAEHLEEIARELDREATRVEQAQATWKRRFAEIEDQARRLLREAREAGGTGGGGAW